MLKWIHSCLRRLGGQNRSGLGSRTLATLALVVTHNLKLAMTDPLADDPDDDADDDTNGTGDDSEVETNDDILDSEDDLGDGHSRRAPP